MHELDKYLCNQCRADLRQADAESVVCVSCGQVFPVSHDILDTLVRPSPAVIQELQGTAAEQGLGRQEWESIKVRRLERARDLETLLAGSEAEPAQYYQQTTLNFEAALEHVGARTGVRRVLEIGAEYDYYFLKRFREQGAECVALNIRFDYATPDPYLSWPEKVLADMNLLPFKDASFDIVLMSATSHHSPDLGRTMLEVSRILRPDGQALIINDPVGGWLKGLGAAHKHPLACRHQDIHENEYSLFQYQRAFQRAGLQPRYLFSEFHSQKLSNPGRIHRELRFAGLARMLSIPWRIPAIQRLARRYSLLPAHVLFGLPLNVVARKASPARHEA